MGTLSAVVLVWGLGLFTVVPACVWLLLTDGTRDHMALLIVLPLWWVFGYFPTVMPVLTALRVRRWMRLLDEPQQLLDQLRALPDGAAEGGRQSAREGYSPPSADRRPPSLPGRRRHALRATFMHHPG